MKININYLRKTGILSFAFVMFYRFGIQRYTIDGEILLKYFSKSVMTSLSYSGTLEIMPLDIYLKMHSSG